MKKVKLDAIAEALDWVDDETSVYYNTETGETVMYNENWDNEDIDMDEIDFDDKYIALPDQYEINEYHMMEAFAYDHNDDRLIIAIQGRGAFRRFKDTVDYVGLRNEWFEFRDNCYRSRAEDWCRDHGLEWE